MKYSKILTVSLTVIVALLVSTGFSQEESAIDSDAIIQKVVEVEARQKAELNSVIFDAEYIEMEKDENGGLKEKVRLEKTVTLKYTNDSVTYDEKFNAYYKNGVLMSEQDLVKIAREKTDKKKKRGSRDISYAILSPFYEENRQDYSIAYLGVQDSSVNAFLCHKFRVESLTKNDKAINGDYYFDADSFQLVKVNFTPARKGGNLFFKMKKLEMSMICAPNSDGYWFPTRFDIAGQGKAMFFIGVSWAGTEYFRNPRVNTIEAEPVSPQE